MDLRIVEWVAVHLHNPLCDWLMPKITLLGEGGLIWIVLTLLLLIFPKTRRTGCVCATALLLMLILNEGILKHLVQRARPFTHLEGLELLIPAPSSYPFPSGHTSSSFACAASLWMYHRKWGWWALGLAVLIALSRLYLSVHYSTDILAGALVGMVCALIARWIWERHWNRSSHGN